MARPHDRGPQVRTSSAADERDWRLTQTSLKHCCDLPKAISQGVDLCQGVVEGERSADCSGQSKLCHDRLGTVVTSANRNALQIQHRSDIGRIEITDYKGKHSSFFGGCS